MENDSYKYARGQIWWVDLTNSVGSVENKIRTALIVSSNQGNSTSQTVTVVPITSQRRPNMAVNVVYNSDRGRMTIICSQLITVDKRQISGYFGVVSDDVMQSVESAMCTALNIRRYNATLKDLSDTLQDVYNKYIGILDRSKCDVRAEDVVKDVQHRVQEFRDEINALALRSSGIDIGKDQFDPPDVLMKPDGKEEEYSTQDIEQSSEQEQTATVGHRVWTTEDKQSFLDDCAKNTVVAVMNKWGLLSKRTVYSYKSKFRKEFLLK